MSDWKTWIWLINNFSCDRTVFNDSVSRCCLCRFNNRVQQCACIRIDFICCRCCCDTVLSFLCDCVGCTDRQVRIITFNRIERNRLFSYIHVIDTNHFCHWFCRCCSNRWLTWFFHSCRNARLSLCHNCLITYTSICIRVGLICCRRRYRRRRRCCNTCTDFNNLVLFFHKRCCGIDWIFKCACFRVHSISCSCLCLSDNTCLNFILRTDWQVWIFFINRFIRDVSCRNLNCSFFNDLCHWRNCCHRFNRIR